MPFDFEPFLARQLHRQRLAEWTAAFADHLRRLGSKVDPEQLHATAQDVLMQSPTMPLESPTLAARLWVEEHGLPR